MVRIEIRKSTRLFYDFGIFVVVETLYLLFHRNSMNKDFLTWLLMGGSHVRKCNMDFLVIQAAGIIH